MHCAGYKSVPHDRETNKLWIPHNTPYWVPSQKSPPKNENISAITKNKLPNSQIVLILMINTLNYYQKLFSKTSACAPFKSLHVQLSVQLTCLACNLQKKPAPQTAQSGAGKHKVTWATQSKAAKCSFEVKCCPDFHKALARLWLLGNVEHFFFNPRGD